MSTQTGKWREEQVLVLCPGSQTTLAQLGCNELTPPAHRFPTRMFRDSESSSSSEDYWRPYHTYRRKKEGSGESGSGGGLVVGEGGKEDGGEGEGEWEFVEDVDSVEGAVYPIQAGRIVNMDAFLAFLEHVHAQLTTTYHNTPIMLMASPQWTRPDCETIARYIFEKTKTPALCLIHSGIATQYGLKWPNMTVVDVGFQKVDVTCIHDGRVVSHRDVGPADTDAISGGEVFTQRLFKLLESKGFDYDMAEQLKKSAVCEVLPYAPEQPELVELPVETASAPAAAASTAGPGNGAAAGASALSGDGAKPAEQPAERLLGNGNGENGTNGEGREGGDDDGVLDVANIVASGQTREFLAKKEKEKAEKGKPGRKPKDKEAAAAAEAAAKAIKLPNSKRYRGVFHYEELVTEDVPIAEPPKENGGQDVGMTEAPAVAEGAASAAPTATAGDEPKAEGEPTGTEEQKPEAEAQSTPAVPQPVQPTESAPAPSTAATTTTTTATERVTRRVRRDIEVGLERFQFADRREIDRIVAAIYHAVQGIEDMYMRPGCWENLVFVGNGARIRGLRDNILQTLQARHLISPSTATMFTSELPSNIGTPSATGSQTPTASGSGQLPTTSSVNPLLLAATTGANPNAPNNPNNAGDAAAGGNAHTSHHFHSQTPTNIRLAPLPSYLTEWTKHGFEEAMFLGAQVAARLAFCIHNLDAQGLEAQRLMSLSRVDYNELGPKGVRSHSMLG
ncbi:actin-like protein ARP9 [Dichotomopilus funicola]|uniref:Actin-like protein ARP9 n=1 Tax=Dichotomopilus funicola TaxID=1934379 RepID=A0AAN6V0C7_9PEZI|nr:actin-like protein ARP9 [Dichotomopilus funicola]